MNRKIFFRRGREKEPAKPVSESGIAGRVPPGLALAGTALATGALYLCHYVFVQELAAASPAALAAGLGLLGSFCVLTVAAIGSIRQLIFNPGNRFRPVLSLVIFPPGGENVPVAKLDIAPGYGPGDWGFESLQARLIAA
jgi:hypothetical protein